MGRPPSGSARTVASPIPSRPRFVAADHHRDFRVVAKECLATNSANDRSDWQDLNLRPPRPERGSGPAEFASGFASELLSTGQDEAARG
jgi:hypothetical protein